jgi:hypothetical protein
MALILANISRIEPTAEPTVKLECERSAPSNDIRQYEILYTLTGAKVAEVIVLETKGHEQTVTVFREALGNPLTAYHHQRNLSCASLASCSKYLGHSVLICSADSSNTHCPNHVGCIWSFGRC